MLKTIHFRVLLLALLLCSVACQMAEVEDDFEVHLKEQWKLRGNERLAFLLESFKEAERAGNGDYQIEALYFIGYYYENSRQFSKSDSVYEQVLDLTIRYDNPEWEVSTLINKAQVLIYQRDFIEAETLLKRAQDVLPNQPNEELEAYVYSAWGLYHNRKSDVQEAIGSYNQALEVFKEVDNSKMTLVTLNYLGIHYAALGLYDLSSERYLDAATLALQQQDTAQYISAIYQSGINLIENQDYREALNLGLKALELQRQTKDPAKYARILNNIGDAYLGLFKRTLESSFADSAYFYINRSLEAKTSIGDEKGRAFSLFNLGHLASVRKDPSGENYFLEAKTIWMESNDAVNLSKVNLALADLYGRDNPRKARFFLGEAEVNNKVTANLKDRLSILDARVRLLSETGDQKSLRRVLKQRDSLGIIFDSSEREKAVAASEVRLQTAELTYQNEQLSKDKSYQEQLAELRMWLLIIMAVVLVLVIGSLFLVRNRNKKLHSLNSRIKNLKDTVLHSQTNAINLLGSLVRLQEKSADSSTDKKILQQINGRISALGGMTRLLYEEQFSNEAGSASVDLKDYLEEILNETLATIPNKGIKVLSHFVHIDFASHKALVLGLIVNELLINFFKHAEPLGADKIELKVEVSPGFLSFEYRDNGPGLINGDTRENFGSFMMTSLVEDLKGKIDKFSDKGLNYQIQIPN